MIPKEAIWDSSDPIYYPTGMAWISFEITRNDMHVKLRFLTTQSVGDDPTIEGFNAWHIETDGSVEWEGGGRYDS